MLFSNENVIFEKVLEGKEAVYGEYRFDSPRLNHFLSKNNIKLYSHQADALKKILKENRNVVITTPTASGKSLIYTLAILQRIEENPYSTSILIFPLLALANDQHEKIREFIKKVGVKGTVSVYTGQTSQDERKEIKKNPPNILITTPDMLNIGILPFHRQWSKLFENLDFVVIDELHSYRGVLGSHVANVIRRLNRLVEHYRGFRPRYILNSATIRNPSQFAQKFIQDEVVEVSNSGSPSPKRIVRFYRKLKNSEKAEIILDFLSKNIPTIVFLDSRREIELMYIRLKELLKKKGKESLIDYITPYRSGYTHSERKEIEQKLLKGEYKVVLSTSALEMGVDIGSIDACILIGYPGTLSATWQRFGRAGRRGKTAYNLLIPGGSPLDDYFLKNPEDLLTMDMEEPVINPDNPYILKKHLIMMAREKPIHISELTDPIQKYYLRELMLEDSLYIKDNRIYAKDKNHFHIRQTEENYRIVEEDKGREIGSINGITAFYEIYKGGVYIHNGKSYIVNSVDRDSNTVYVSEKSVNYFTDPVLETRLNIIKVDRQKRFGKVELFYGDIEVNTSLIGYIQREVDTGSRLSDIQINQPLQRDFQTKGLWFVLPTFWEEMIKEKTKEEKLKDILLFLNDFPVEQSILDTLTDFLNRPPFNIYQLKSFLEEQKPLFKTLFSKSKSRYADIQDFIDSLALFQESFLGGLHATEHSMIGIFSLVAMNDRWDIGGLSTDFHIGTGGPSVFIYDGFEGGIGYSELGFERFKDLVELTYKSISRCRCLNGCPSCILSPKCGNLNERLDKSSAKVLLRMVMENLTSG